MNEAKARAIVLEYFTKPDFDRVEYLKQQQKESDRPPEIFTRYIVDAFQYFFKKLEGPIIQARAMGNELNNYGIPFFHLDPDKYQPGFGHLYYSQMPELWEGIKQYINESHNITPASNKAEKLANPRTTKRDITDLTAIAIALIHVFTKEPITMENRVDIATRYKKPNDEQYDPKNLYNEYGLIPETETERLRQKPTTTLFNHYRRCIHWLKTKGFKPAEKAANYELKQLQNKQLNH